MPKSGIEGFRVETNPPKLSSTNRGVCIEEGQWIIDLKNHLADPEYISFTNLFLFEAESDREVNLKYVFSA